MPFPGQEGWHEATGTSRSYWCCGGMASCGTGAARTGDRDPRHRRSRLSSSKTQMELLRAGMRELGLFEGKDYVFVARHFSGKTEHFRAPAFYAVRLLHDKGIARPRLNG